MQVLGKRAAALAVGLPLGAVITPLGEAGAPPPPVLHRPAVTCSACGAMLNLYSKVLSVSPLPPPPLLPCSLAPLQQASAGTLSGESPSRCARWVDEGLRRLLEKSKPWACCP